MARDMVISLQKVSLTLPGPHGPVPILHDIDLEVQQGGMVSVVGASGSGKTSLMMVLAGVQQASGGKIVVDGQDITGLDEDALAAFRQQHIGIVFQNFHLIPTMTALENVAVALEFSGVDDAMEQAQQMLEKVGLKARVDHYPSQLSGGEQQRVALARAMAVRPTLLLADEPTGNLDSETGQQIMELMLELRKEHGTTMLLITHDAALAKHANRTVVMEDGRLHEAADA